MVYLSDKGSENEDMTTRKSHQDGGSSSETESQIRKTCADCGTSKTPLWRGGPAGPKSLCNACGIRSRKKRRALLGLTKPNDKKSKKGNSTSSSSSSNNSGITTKNSNGKNCSTKSIGDSLKRRMMALGKEVLLQRSSMEKLRKKLGEEEQAAVLLMALSYGSVFA